jgi:hypothetical protein
LNFARAISPDGVPEKLVLIKNSKSPLIDNCSTLPHNVAEFPAAPRRDKQPINRVLSFVRRESLDIK